MNVTLVKDLLALVPAGLLFSGSVVLISKGRTVWSLLQVIGAGCLVIVALTHISEALDLFPWMHWGHEASLGHYLDLSSAVLGVLASRCFPQDIFLMRLPRNAPNDWRVSPDGQAPDQEEAPEGQAGTTTVAWDAAA